MARPSEVEIGALGVAAIGVIAALLGRRKRPDSARLPGAVVLAGRSTPFATPMRTRKESRLRPAVTTACSWLTSRRRGG